MLFEVFTPDSCRFLHHFRTRTLAIILSSTLFRERWKPVLFSLIPTILHKSASRCVFKLSRQFLHHRIVGSLPFPVCRFRRPGFQSRNEKHAAGSPASLTHPAYPPPKEALMRKACSCVNPYISAKAATTDCEQLYPLLKAPLLFVFYLPYYFSAFYFHAKIQKVFIDSCSFQENSSMMFSTDTIIAIVYSTNVLQRLFT